MQKSFAISLRILFPWHTSESIPLLSFQYTKSLLTGKINFKEQNQANELIGMFVKCSSGDTERAENEWGGIESREHAEQKRLVGEEKTDLEDGETVFETPKGQGWTEENSRDW